MQGLCESTINGLHSLREMLNVGSIQKNHGNIKEMSDLKFGWVGIIY